MAWNYDTYVKIGAGVVVSEIEKKLLLIRDDYIAVNLRKAGQQGIEEFQKNYQVRCNPSTIYI